MKLLASSVAVLLAFPALAEDKVAPLTGEVEFGVIATSGNTETTSVKGKVAIKHELEKWKNNYMFDALYNKDDESTTANRWFASAQGDYKLNEADSALFVYGSYEDDKFSGFDYQSTIAVGYSDKLFNNEQSFLSYNIGPGYNVSENNAGDKQEAGIVRLAAEYQYKFSDTAKFTQLLSTEAAIGSGKNTRSKSETSISAKLMGNLSMKAAYTITNNSEAPEGSESTDTVTSITVVYMF